MDTSGPTSPSAARSLRRLSVMAVIAVLVVLLAEIGFRLWYPDPLRNEGWPDATYPTRVANIERFGPADVLLVGPSVVESGLDPGVLSKSWNGQVVFNGGLAGAYPDDYMLWAREVLIPRLDPDTVVIGAMEFGADAGTCNICLRSSWAYRRFVGAESFVDRLPGQGSNLVRYGQTIVTPKATKQLLEVAEETSRSQEQLPDGYVRVETDGFIDFQIKDPRLDRQTDENLRDFVNELQAEGRRVIITYVPTFAAYQADERDDFMRFQKSWQEIAESTGAEWIPLPETGFDSQSMYRDSSHLDAEAVVEYSTWLGERLDRL